MDPTAALAAWHPPERLVVGFVFLSMMLGDILKKLDLAGWVIPANGFLGAVVACLWFRRYDMDTVLMGIVLGFAATGAHRLLKQVGARG